MTSQSVDYELMEKDIYELDESKITLNSSKSELDKLAAKNQLMWYNDARYWDSAIQKGKDCFDAIVSKDAQVLGDSMVACMRCWETILPNTVRHSTIAIDLMAILNHYQKQYYGAMYSGCGGGYIYVVSDQPVPGGFQVKVKKA